PVQTARRLARRQINRPSRDASDCGKDAGYKPEPSLHRVAFPFRSTSSAATWRFSVIPVAGTNCKEAGETPDKPSLARRERLRESCARVECFLPGGFRRSGMSLELL